MRVLFVNIPTGKEDGEFGQFVKTAYVPFLQKNLDMVKQPDTKIVYRFCEWGMGPMAVAFTRYLDHLASRMIYHAAANAKEEGFDAVVINCFGDPMLWEVRQALDIPVVGLGESSMLLSTFMGLKFGIVHISPFNIPETEEHVVKYGLKERCAGIRPIAESASEQEQALFDARHTIEAFAETARELIADGAEILIPGCSVMAPAIRLAPGAEKEYPNGVTEIDGVPIYDLLGGAIKMAETLVALKQGGSAWISRKLLYAQPAQEVKEVSKMLTEEDRLKFWDYTPD